MVKFHAVSARPFLTTAEYAEIRNCSVRTIESERQNGTGAKYLKINGMVRYRAEDVDEFPAAAERASTKEAAQ